MSYHHWQRTWDHLEAIRDKDKQAKFSGAHRHEKLSAIALALAYALAELTDPRTGTCSYSVRQIVAKTKRTSAGIRAGLEELVEWGIYERERSSRRQKFTYRLKLECPPDCQKLALHYPPGQIPNFESANKQHTQTEAPDTERANSLPTERANSQLSVELSTSPLKEIKETKKKVSSCSFCRGEPETIAGKLRQIHSREDCPNYRSLEKGIPWAVAIRKYEQLQGTGEWAGLSIKDKQRTYYVGLAKSDLEKQNKLEAIDLQKQKLKESFEKLIANTCLLPNWIKWLWKRVELRGSLEIEQELALAEKYSRQENDLVPGRGNWETGAYADLDLSALEFPPVEVMN